MPPNRFRQTNPRRKSILSNLVETHSRRKSSTEKLRCEYGKECGRRLDVIADNKTKSRDPNENAAADGDISDSATSIVKRRKVSFLRQECPKGTSNGTLDCKNTERPLAEESLSKETLEEEEIDYESTDEGESPHDLQQLDDIPSQFLEKLMNFNLFHNAPRAFYVAIVRKLTLVIHHAQEFIVRAGEPARAMYWILRGSVNVTSPDGEAIHAELFEGSYFGEIGILFNRPRTATVIAKTRVLVGVLTAENFNQVLPDFPTIERQIRDEAQERLAMQDKKRKAGVVKMLTQNSDIVRNNIPISGDDEIQSMAVPPLPIPPQSPEQLLNPPQLRLRPRSRPNHQLNISLKNIDDSISIRQFLKSLPLFTTLPADIIHGLALCVELKQVDAFQYIFRRGDYGKDIYFIVGGEVEVLGSSSLKSSHAGEEETVKDIEILLARLGPGQYFGEMGFLTSITDDEAMQESIRSADIRTVSSCTLLVLTGQTLRDFCERYPLIKLEIKRTAEERNKKNIGIGSNPTQETEFEVPSPSSETTLVSQEQVGQIVEAPVSRRNYLTMPILTEQTSRNLSQVSMQTPPLSNFPFNPSFSFSHTRNESVTSPLKVTAKKMASLSSTTISSRSVSPMSKSNNDSGMITRPLEIHVPPLNPLPLPKDSFVNNLPAPFHYMPHHKRLRLSNISGGRMRRRSSVLTVGPLPDRILLRCFQYLALPELMKLRLVCRRWRQLLYVAPGLFDRLDLTPWNNSIDDKSLTQITDFVGSRPKFIDISNCYHVTDEGFSYMINEIGISGQIKGIKIRGCWEVSAMAIMDIAVPSIGNFLEEIDLTNCRKVRDDVVQRLIGWDYAFQHHALQQQRKHSKAKNGGVCALDEPIPGMEMFDPELVSKVSAIGCRNLKKLVLRYCKGITDLTLYHLSLYANDKLSELDLTRCTGLTDNGFSYWGLQRFERLESLILSECIFLTDISIRSIANCASNLRILNLSFCCSLTDASIELLCLGCPQLENLNLSFCGRAVGDVSLLGISMHLRKLQKISLKGCLRVTRSGVDSLLGGFAPLQFIDISQCKNAHMYQGGIEATKFETLPGCRSIYLTMENNEGRCVKVVV